MPFRFQKSQSKRLFVFGTSETQHIKEYVTYQSLSEGLRNPDLKIVTPSQWSKLGFLNAGFREDRIEVVPHGVDCTIFKPPSPEQREQMRRKLGISESEFVILSVGSMMANKGMDLLLRAYALLRRNYKHVRLVLKDASSLYRISGSDIFAALAKSHPDLVTPELQSSIIFVSQNLTLPQMSGLYGAADCYASPYRAEGFNLPPLEAAACGTPIVITKGGATDDYHHPSYAMQIEGKKITLGNDTIIEPEFEDLVFKLANLIEGKRGGLDRDLALTLIAQKFSWPEVVRKLTGVFGL